MAPVHPGGGEPSNQLPFNKRFRFLYNRFPGAIRAALVREGLTRCLLSSKLAFGPRALHILCSYHAVHRSLITVSLPKLVQNFNHVEAELPVTYEAKFICVNCIEDDGLLQFIQENAIGRRCSFCLTCSEYPFAAPITDVSEHFMACLFEEYDLAGNQLGWVGSEGGWIGTYWDSFDLACEELELEFPQSNEHEILSYLFGSYYIDQDWCERDAYGLNDQERAKYSWDHFCQVVMHERRYFFQDDEDSDDYADVDSPAETLSTIFEFAQQMNLCKVMASDSCLYRVRWESTQGDLKTPEDMGPPPEENANQPNRMSPAGIPMFYGCDDEETALKETASGSGYFAIGRFATVRPLVILDLTEKSPIPSLFEPVPDSLPFRPREVLKFLQHIANEFSRQIERGDRIHVEYVPAQIVAEFVRSQLTWEGSRMDGIKYISSVYPGRVCYAIFANQSNVVGTPDNGWSDDHMLKLINVDHIWFCAD